MVMITEIDKDTIYFSSLFARHYPELYGEIKDILTKNGVSNGTITNTADYFCRDYMPVQIDMQHYLLYIYDPDYLKEEPEYTTDIELVLSTLKKINVEVVKIPLKLDGGNMIFCQAKNPLDETSYIVMTDKVMIENESYSKSEIETIIKEPLLKTCKDVDILWLPWDESEKCGHTDSIVRYVGIGETGKPKVFVNLEVYEEKDANDMYDILSDKMEVVEIQLPEYDELSWAYINSVQTDDIIIVPGLGNQKNDATVMEQYETPFPYYKGKIYLVQMREYVKEWGAALNCSTWTIKQK